MTAARLDLGRKAWLVMANFGDACGHAVGCPTAIVVRRGRNLEGRVDGMTTGAVPFFPRRTTVSAMSKWLNGAGYGC